MNTTDIIKNLRDLRAHPRGGAPRAAWKESTRRVLLAEAENISATHASHAGRWSLMVQAFTLFTPERLFARALKPAFAGAGAVAMALGGWVTTVSASYGSLPGDRLYAVKIAAEHAQTTLALHDADRVRLRMEFLGRRVDEVTKLTENPKERNAEKVSIAVRQMKEELTSVEHHLDTLKQNKPNEAAEAARLVDRKASELQNTLSHTVRDASGEVQNEVKQAKELVADTSVKAVSVLVETNAGGSVQITTDAIKEKIQERLAAVSATTPAAKEAAGEVTTLLSNNDLSGALSKVVEVTKLSREAEASSTAPAAPALTGPAPTSSASVTLPLIGQVPPPENSAPEGSASGTTP